MLGDQSPVWNKGAFVAMETVLNFQIFPTLTRWFLLPCHLGRIDANAPVLCSFEKCCVMITSSTALRGHICVARIESVNFCGIIKVPYEDKIVRNYGIVSAWLLIRYINWYSSIRVAFVQFDLFSVVSQLIISASCMTDIVYCYWSLKSHTFGI